MEIQVKCYATLSSYQPEEAEHFPIAPGESVLSLLKRLGLDKSEVKVVFVNGKHAAGEQRLAHGDRVAVFPAVGGG
ncbi:MAG: MoaD/ThiS family protein [Desulfohalobiaceae bacterium]|nr:MoaD/ThiS family protein [Desulfohalobiaceae bacterium]